MASCNASGLSSCEYVTMKTDKCLTPKEDVSFDGTIVDLKVQLDACITFPNNRPMKLGEDVLLKLTMENVGRKVVPQGSVIIFNKNTYFRQRPVFLKRNIGLGEEHIIDIKLVPIKKGIRDLDSQILSLPEVIEVNMLDENNNMIACGCSGFYLCCEDFVGDIFTYKPRYGIPFGNIITFGPTGAGKSSFVNSVSSALGEDIKVLNVAGATRNVVTSGLLQFPLYLIPEFEDLCFAVYDVPGVDGLNYKGDELAMLMYGILPYDIDFKHNAALFRAIAYRRDSEEEERKRRAHVVAFFVPQGAAGDNDLMERLAEFYYQISVQYGRKVVVIISHDDEIAGEEEREEILADVCRKLFIDSSKVFFLENYVDTKKKEFRIDKMVFRILLSLLFSVDDFLTFDRLNPIANPFPR